MSSRSVSMKKECTFEAITSAKLLNVNFMRFRNTTLSINESWQKFTRKQTHSNGLMSLAAADIAERSVAVIWGRICYLRSFCCGRFWSRILVSETKHIYFQCWRFKAKESSFFAWFSVRKTVKESEHWGSGIKLNLLPTLSLSASNKSAEPHKFLWPLAWFEHRKKWSLDRPFIRRMPEVNR